MDQIWDIHSFFNMLFSELSGICQAVPDPIILFLYASKCSKDFVTYVYKLRNFEV